MSVVATVITGAASVKMMSWPETISFDEMLAEAVLAVFRAVLLAETMLVVSTELSD